MQTNDTANMTGERTWAQPVTSSSGYNPPPAPTVPGFDQQCIPSDQRLPSPPPGYSTGAYPTGYWYPPPADQPINASVRYPMENGGEPPQRQSVVVIQQHLIPVRRSFSAHYTLSCCAFWFCGWLFGGIAFCLASSAEDECKEGHDKKSAELGTASIVFSLIGIITGCVLWGWLIYIWTG